MVVRLVVVGTGIGFFCLLEGHKLRCYYFMGAGRGHETPGPETEGLIAHSTAATMSMSMSTPLAPSPSPNPMSVKCRGLHPCCGYSEFVLGFRSTECGHLPLL